MATPNSKKPKRSRSNDDSKRSPTKRQFRNENEKRRRDLFSQLIVNLEENLQIENKSSADEKSNKLDKSTILRETVLFLKKHRNNLTIQPTLSRATTTTTTEQTNDVLDFSWKPLSNLVTNEDWLQLVIESMHCFFLVTKPDPSNGQIVFVSTNISSLLDYSQNELLNRSLFELVLVTDHDRLRDYLLKEHRVLEKCHLSWRRATGDEYEQCTIIGAFREVNRGTGEKYLMSLVQVNTGDKTLITNNEHPINEYQTRLNLHGRFIHIDSKAREFLGYNTFELIGHTHFDFVHPDDLPVIARAHRLWKETGNGTSEPYRFLTKGQQWVFLQTYCQVQINSWTEKPESYLCRTKPLRNSSDSLQEQLSNRSRSTSIQSSLTTDSMIIPSSQRTNIASNSQMSWFLSNIGNESYQRSIRERLNVCLLYKQEEIHVREKEIKLIGDILQFIEQFQSKQHSSDHLTSSFPFPLSAAAIQTTCQLMQEDSATNLRTKNDPTLLQTSFRDAIEDFSPGLSAISPRQRLSTQDETLIDSIPYPLSSPPPQQGMTNLSSPLTPFSIRSRPSPVSLSPATPNSPFATCSTVEDINHCSSSSSSSSSTVAKSTTSNVSLTEQPPARKSSFNRSLPHSLVS